MKIDRRSRIEKAAGEEGRYALQAVQLAGDVVAATDGRILAVVPIEREEGDVDGLIGADVFRKARPTGSRSAYTVVRPNGSIVYSPKGKDADGTVAVLRPDGAFPKWGEVVPDNKGLRVSLNAELLHNLAQALGDDIVTLTFAEGAGSGDPGAILVNTGPDGIEGAYGVIMPYIPSRR